VPLLIITIIFYYILLYYYYYIILHIIFCYQTMRTLNCHSHSQKFQWIMMSCSYKNKWQKKVKKRKNWFKEERKKEAKVGKKKKRKRKNKRRMKAINSYCRQFLINNLTICICNKRLFCNTLSFARAALCIDNYSLKCFLLDIAILLTKFWLHFLTINWCQVMFATSSVILLLQFYIFIQRDKEMVIIIFMIVTCCY